MKKSFAYSLELKRNIIHYELIPRGMFNNDTSADK